MTLEQCYRIYLTEIDQSFECDTFLPKIDFEKFRQVFDPEVPRVRFVVSGRESFARLRPAKHVANIQTMEQKQVSAMSTCITR